MPKILLRPAAPQECNSSHPCKPRVPHLMIQQLWDGVWMIIAILPSPLRALQHQRRQSPADSAAPHYSFRVADLARSDYNGIKICFCCPDQLCTTPAVLTPPDSDLGILSQKDCYSLCVYVSNDLPVVLGG